MATTKCLTLLDEWLRGALEWLKALNLGQDIIKRDLLNEKLIQCSIDWNSYWKELNMLESSVLSNLFFRMSFEHYLQYQKQNKIQQKLS